MYQKEQNDGRKERQTIESKHPCHFMGIKHYKQIVGVN